MVSIDEHENVELGCDQQEGSPCYPEQQNQKVEIDNNSNNNNNNNNSNNDDDDDDDDDDEGGDHNDEFYKSHFRNSESFPLYLRLGIPLFLFCTFILLLCADIGSGVTADTIMMEDGAVLETNNILNVSVISSVGKLWDAESYPLAIFIAITSIGWPYIKLALATYSWMMPYHNSKRREKLIEIIDALGKWSFVDIMVIVEIMVAFRSTVNMGYGISLEVVLVAQWGFYGFVIATMMSLLSTHVILHYHRQLHYHEKNTNNSNINIAATNENCNNNLEGGHGTFMSEETHTNKKHGMKALGELSTGHLIVIVVSILLSMILYLAGAIVKSFEVTSSQGTDSETIQYSVTSIGLEVDDAYIDSSHTGTRFIQTMWFFLGVIMPLWCSCLLLVLYTVPSLSKVWMERIFTMAEIAFAWSCAEVLLLSTIFAVLQMPIFGAKLVENDCKTCFVITTQILPAFGLLVVGAFLNVAVNIWLYRKAHGIIYGGKS